MLIRRCVELSVAVGWALTVLARLVKEHKTTVKNQILIESVDFILCTCVNRLVDKLHDEHIDFNCFINQLVDKIQGDNYAASLLE